MYPVPHSGLILLVHICMIVYRYVSALYQSLCLYTLLDLWPLILPPSPLTTILSRFVVLYKQKHSITNTCALQ
ncbi:hypothetical protein F5Y07DRAFT_361973 [Xylaria sp. FL0933]|nr:hypothetical protein F5Y07DRAFT_361973 [Xylaria sp. FL0933]